MCYRVLFVALFVLSMGALADADTVAYYRFEEGADGAGSTGAAPGTLGHVLDSSGNGHHGTAFGSPIYDAFVDDTTIPQTGASNNLSMRFTGASGQVVQVLSPFIFHSQFGDATLEFSMYQATSSHTSIFWTRSGNGDRNRWNIFTNGGFGMDYRNPVGVLTSFGRPVPGFGGTLGHWEHITVTRTQIAANTFDYDFYRNGVFAFTKNAPVTNLPNSTVWEIAGREGFKFVGWIDEVRFSNTALAPDQFLGAGGAPTPIPEPATTWLVLCGVAFVVIHRMRT
ncbi:MAG: LamG-like jellyroll fold domain-containing protein [Planctomycetota bacterium]